VTRPDAEDGVRALLLDLGLPDLAAGDTPRLAVESFRELFSGVGQDPLTPLRSVQPAPGHDLVAIRDIRIRSVCAHHLLPFSGTATVAYRPGAAIAGLGAIPRMIRILAARPQLQEGLTRQIADTLQAGLHPLGAVVLLTTRQGCLSDRGALEADARVSTFAATGDLCDFSAADLRALVGEPGVPGECVRGAGPCW
jgi:GTP cyclohydrolase I